MDTIGSLIDKLFTVDMKMWNNQEIIFDVRHITLDEFRNKYCNSVEGSEKLWVMLKKVCDLNVQRSNLIDEIDEKLVKMIVDGANGKNLDSQIQKKYKTY